jgi:Rrf2 family protein
MRLSAQEEYGLRCLLQLARNGGTRAALTINEISRAEHLSTAYVAKLLRTLRMNGYIESTRGQVGGYMLSRDPESIFVRDVLNDLGGRLYSDECCEKYPGSEDTCAHTFECSIKSIWSRIQSAIDRELDGITLQDLVRQSTPKPPPPNDRPLKIPERLRVV